jgi:hypothetical protein
MATNNATNNYSTGGGPSVYFSAYMTADTAAVTGDGTVWDGIFDTIQYNVGGGYDNVTGLFTAPSAGIYVFNASLNIGGLAAAYTSSQAFFQDPMSNFRNINFFAGNPGAVNDPLVANFGISGSAQIQLALGQQARVVFYAADSVKSIFIQGSTVSAYNTYFSGYKLI